MAIQFSSELLGKYFAPGIDEFRSASIPDLSYRLEDATHWISNHFLNSVAGRCYRTQWRQRVVTFLFRAQIILRAYNEGRVKTLAFLASSTPGRPATRTYFEALASWETVILNIQMAIELLEKARDGKVRKGEDGARLWEMCNRVKHIGEDITKGLHPGEATVPMWMANEGLTTRACKLTYHELAENVAAIADVATELQNPY